VTVPTPACRAVAGLLLTASVMLAVLAAGGCGERRAATGHARPVHETKHHPGLSRAGAAPRRVERHHRYNALRPRIVSWPIPFGARRRAETAAYSERHYGTATYRLSRPRVIVEHVTVTASAQEAWNAFATDAPDPELHELPQVCAHFLIDRDGTIFQLVSLHLICRHTVGLNDRAIGIEHVGMSDAEVIDDRRQLTASLELTRWLRCMDLIRVRDVIGHSESLGSRFHHERVPALRAQTHGDMATTTMRGYRQRLAHLGC